MTTEPNHERDPSELAAMSGDDRGISVGRDASGNAFVTGDHNQVRVIIYQQVRSEQRQPEPPAVTKIGPNPYMGLSAFHEEDAARFFGRETQITRLWERLRDLQVRPRQGEFRPRVLPVLGPSGSGKSSVVRAGLIPELARRPLPGWRDVRVAVMKPGTHPVEELARVLDRIATGDTTPGRKQKEYETRLETKRNTGVYDGLRGIADDLPQIDDIPLLVLVDQFEELYSLCTDVTARTVFIENLLHAASDATRRVSVVITMRSDFLGETQSHEQLNRLICEQQVLIPAMGEAELRAAIAQPAVAAGHPLDDATVKLLLSDSKDRVGALPLLQFALQRIWDGLAKGIPAAKTYEQIGGVGGALAGEAQRIFEGLKDKKEQDIAKRVFLGLVQLGEGTRDTRRRAVVRNLVAADEQLSDVEHVIDRFADHNARLITLSADEHGKVDTAEVTHEALFDHWTKLNDWLHEGREDIRFSRRLEEAAQLWDQQGRPEGGLWRPPNLGLLRDYHRRATAEMSRLQIEFFNASTKAENDRDSAARWRRRLLWSLTGLSITAMIVAVIFGGYALRVGWNAQRGLIDALASAIALTPPKTAGEQIGELALAAPSGWKRNYAIESLGQIAHKPDPEESSREESTTIASGKANVLAALMQFGDRSHVWSELERIQSKVEANQGDPTLRSYAMHRFQETGVDPNVLLDQLEKTKDRPAVLHVLLLSLGEYDANELPEVTRELYLRKVVELYRAHEDPGVHGAAEWLLRRWGKDREIKEVVDQLTQTPKDLSSTKLPQDRGWYVTKSGRTMVYIRCPVRFHMGSPETEKGRDNDNSENLHEVELTQSFAIANKEVAWESFGVFLRDQDYLPTLNSEELKDVKAAESRSTALSMPVTDVSWHVAAAYCNWLTEQELGKEAARTQLCYKPNEAGKYAVGMDVEDDFRRRRGYRLPTEAEWEYACRAGTTTRWSHGDAEELLARFARFDSPPSPQSSPIGSLKPNGFGLFDMHGNAWEWCQDCYAAKAVSDPFGPRKGSFRVIRGGGWGLGAANCRSADRSAGAPPARWNGSGFRLALSLSGVSSAAEQWDRK